MASGNVLCCFNCSPSTIQSVLTYCVHLHVCTTQCTHVLCVCVAVSPEDSVLAEPTVSNNSLGDNQTFNCSAMGGPGNMFSWIRLYDNVTVGNTSSLTVSVEGADDGGMYRCEVTNLAGNGSDTVTLNGED